MPAQKNVLPAGPKLEPFHVLLQVATQSDATYLPGYSWHVNKRIPNARLIPLQFFCMPTQKIVLPAGPKFEPFYVSLQVAAQSDATYVPGYSWHVNKRVPNGNINYSCHGSAQPSYQLLGREGHLWQWGHLWKQNYWQYSLQADNSFHRPNSNSHPGRYTGSAYTSAWRVLTFVWS